MNNITLQAGVTISSIDLCDIVNTARASADEIEVQSNHFLSRVEDELDDLGIVKVLQNPAGGRPRKYYDLTIEQCLLVGMRESKAVRRSVLAKLKGMEAEKQSPAFVLPTTMAEALRLAADQSEQLEIAAPKVAFVDNYVTANGNKGFRETAKLLNISEPEFRDFLTENKIMYYLGKTLTGYAQHIDAGRITTKAVIDGAGTARNQAMFTPKGVEWIAGVLAKSKARKLL